MSGLTRGKVAAYSVVLFLAGGICGAMVESKLKVNAEVLAVDRAAQIATNIQTRLQTRLELTPDQLEKIKPLTVAASEALEASHRACLDQISKIIADLHQKVALILTETQKSKLSALDEERRESWLQKYHYQEKGTNSASHL